MTEKMTPVEYMKQLKDTYKENISIGAEKIDCISTGIFSLDKALGGGIPKRRFTLIFGPEGSCKTTIALKTAGEMQKWDWETGEYLGNNPTPVAFIDLEASFDQTWASKHGVLDDPNYLSVIRPGYAEQAVDIINDMILSSMYGLIILDSIEAMFPKSAQEKSVEESSSLGERAKLVNNAYRKWTTSLIQSMAANEATPWKVPTLICLNQLREKIGVIYGCFSKDAPVVLADGTTEKIGKIVKQRLPVSVLSFNETTKKVESKRIVDYFDNGPAGTMLKIATNKNYANGKSSFTCTPDHLIFTPDGEIPAKSLRIGSKVLQRVTHVLSKDQSDVIRGMFLGDGHISKYGNLRFAHCKEQADYLDWKLSFLPNIDKNYYTRETDGAVFCDTAPIKELCLLYNECTLGKNRQYTQDFFDSLSDLALAIWYQDDGTFSIRSEGLQTRTVGRSGRCSISVKSFTQETCRNVERSLLTRGIVAKVNKRGNLVFDRENSDLFLDRIAPYLHPSMEYKALERHKGRFVNPKIEIGTPTEALQEAVVTSIQEVKCTGSRYDIAVEDNHNYFVDHILVHNSPITLPGGKGQNFYSHTRIELNTGKMTDDTTKTFGVGEFSGIIKKSKLTAPRQRFTFEMSTKDTVAEPAGYVNNAKAVVKLLKAEGAFIKLDKGWEILGEVYAKQDDFQNRLREDAAFYQSVVSLILSNGITDAEG